MSEELKINMPLFNIGEEAELENKLLFHLDEFTNEIMKTMTRDKDIIILKKVIERQQKEIEEKSTIIMAGAEKVKQLEKGNRSLMESRIKWKDRYYKEKAKNKEKKMISQAIIRDTFIADYISKDKIREKIEKYENDYKRQDKEELFNLTKITAGALSALQELLEGK